MSKRTSMHYVSDFTFAWKVIVPPRKAAVRAPQNSVALAACDNYLCCNVFQQRSRLLGGDGRRGVPGASAEMRAPRTACGTDVAEKSFVEIYPIRPVTTYAKPVSGNRYRGSGNRLPLDEGGCSMSRVSSKVVVAVVLGFTALTASGCTFPLTVSCGGTPPTCTSG